MSGLRGKERGGKESKRGRGQGQCVCMRELLRLEAFSDRASRGSVRWSAGSRCRGSKLFADTTLALLGVHATLVMYYLQIFERFELENSPDLRCF